MIYNKSGGVAGPLYDKTGGDAAVAYNKDGVQVYPDATPFGWSDVKWVCVGDSLTDPTINAKKKYHAVIDEMLDVGSLTVLGKGSTGYWAGQDKGTCFYQRMTGAIPADTNIITLFGSVNDWKWYNGGIQLGTVDDTLDAGTYAGYVDEAIRIAQEQAPNAKIIICGTPYFTKDINYTYWRKATEINKAKAAKYGLPFYDMYASNAICNPSNVELGNYQYMFNFAFNYRAKVKGLNFSKMRGSTFNAAYDMQDATGHPNNAYHHDYIAPMFANYICEVMDIDKATLPDALRIVDGATTDYLDAYVRCISIKATYKGTAAAGDAVTPGDFDILTTWDDGSTWDYWAAHGGTVSDAALDDNAVYLSMSNTDTGADSVTLQGGANTVYILYGSNSPYYSVKTSVQINV